MRLLLALPLAVLLLGACAGSGGAWRTFRAHGVSIRLPPGWHATAAALTPVTAPAQVLAVASYPLPKDDSGADGCEPKAALDRLPADGAFLFGWEDGPADFPRRPAHFRLANFAPYECFGPSYALRFSDHGRAFQVHVALGRHASATTRRLVLRILDSFRARLR